MPRLPHGRLDVTPDTVSKAREAVAERVAANAEAPFVVKPVDTRRFDFLFPELQENSDNLLPESRTTRDALVDLGIAMSSTSRVGSGIPAAYTYFGQFVDHDITFDTSSATGSQLTSPDLEPLPLNRIRQETQNIRTAALELDSVYGLPAPRDGVKMEIGKVTALGASSKPGLRPPGKDDDNDLPREPRGNDVVHDRAALIGDPRNDENTIIAQLQVAFLRAHNKLVDEIDPPNRFRRAKRRLRRHYQHIVLHDFLKRIVDPQVVDDIIENGNKVYNPDDDEFFMPLEYSVAVYRFGHSMVRAGYNFNLNFNFSGEPGTIRGTLDLLFTFTALSGQLGDFPTLPENWIIEWENIIDAGTGEPPQEALRIDTELVEPLDHLRILTGDEEGDPTVEPNLPARLAVRNLLRGYLLRLPTGQAVARALQIPELTPEEITQNAANDAEVQALEKGGFPERTPLWYYILAEAAVRADGQRLGPVGSTIVAEVLVGLVRRSPDSILDPESTWQPNLPTPDKGSNLADLLRFAGVLT
jgi:Animal haem peroxidase